MRSPSRHSCSTRAAISLAVALALGACSGGDPVLVADAGIVDLGADLGEHDLGPAVPDAGDMGGACATMPCGVTFECVEEGGVPRCVCPAGTHEDGGACVADVRCEPTTCGGHGACDDAGGSPVCACELGYVGPSCTGCDDASGYARNHLGECVADLCAPSPCSDSDRLRCVVDSGAARCDCNAGTHDVAGTCVPDVVCADTTCSGHGVCSVGPSGLGCACDAGWDGVFCDRCADGLHADGAGGCTSDPCVPSPCTEPRRSACAPDGGGTATCGCDPGAHLDAGACVADEICAASSCSGRGTCSVVGGRRECACAAGYVGAACESCAATHHADGAGGCTDDPCAPSPCTTAGQTVCVAAGTLARCDCDSGYHADGAGGCTMDPCVPSPCLATMRACRVSAGGAVECYTPPCDDGNPCTNDGFDGVRCTSTALPDGAPCSTSLCRSGDTCSASVCGGGAPRSCDDGNDCTRDSCAATSGCGNVVDDTLVPSDGVACTIDRCSAGAAVHSVSHPACDDGSWCTGTEQCRPTDAAADARGCVATAVPASPGPATTCGRYACDDGTRTFTFATTAGGTACDDRLACTSTDRCNGVGACVGTVTASCGTTCVASSTWSASIDIPTSRVTGVITVAGAVLPATVASTYAYDADLYLVARDTAIRHRIASIDYSYDTGSTYRLVAGTDRVAATLVPGLYDLVFERARSTGATYDNVGRTTATDPYPTASRILRSAIVIGAGYVRLDVDIPLARVTGVITVAGAVLPATVTSTYAYDADLYLVARDTAIRHRVASIDYSYDTGSTYRLVAGTDRVAATLVPGTYDLVFERARSTGATYDNVGRTTATDPYPTASRIVTAGVVVPAGDFTLDVDIPIARLTGPITLDGASLPATVTSNYAYDAELYLVASDTGLRHRVASIDYSYDTGSTYRLVAGTDRIAATLMPGTYDLLFERARTTGATYDNVGRTDANDPYPAASRLLGACIVVP